MTSTKLKSAETLADDIVGVDAYEPALPPKRNKFEPWHQPRKQLVRDYQWREQIKLMLDVISGDKTLKYLGLPGEDLLDLRYFYEVICEPNELSLKFLGFNFAASPKHPDNAAFQVSLDEVLRLPRVDAQSNVAEDNFFVIANKNSLAWEKVKKAGPYHVVNLDLCDGLCLSSGELNTEKYDAVRELIAFQGHNKTPWLLFITTRIGKNYVDKKAFKAFIDIYLKNLTSCADFMQLSQDKFSVDASAAKGSDQQDDQKSLTVFTVGLCKWMLGLALELKPHWTVELRDIHGYRVEKNAQHEDLVSFALKFEPTFSTVPDKAGLARSVEASPNECDLAVKILGKMSKYKNADKLLAENGALRKRMLDATAQLLAQARYNVDAYYDAHKG